MYFRRDVCRVYASINLVTAFSLSACFQRAMLGLSEMNTISVWGSFEWIPETNSLKSANTCSGDFPAQRSLPPARRKTVCGWQGKMIRTAKWVQSTICDPPKPRLITRCFGKSCASVFQRRMVEEPVNSTAPFGGGLARAICSYAEISFSHFPKSCPSEHRAMGQEATIRKPINECKAMRFMCTHF